MRRISQGRSPPAAVLARSGNCADDPFARILPATLLAVGAGLIGNPKPVASLVIERYGGQQWPVDRFPGDRDVMDP